MRRINVGLMVFTIVAIGGMAPAALGGAEGDFVFRLDKKAGTVRSIRVEGRELVSRALVGSSGFFIEDVGNARPEVRAGGSFRERDGGIRQKARLRKLGLELEADYAFKPDRVEVHGRIRDLTGSDRAVIVKFLLPVNARGWKWWDDIRTARPILDTGLYRNCTSHGEGGGKHSTYTWSCISKDVSLCMGIPLAVPIVHRISYDSSKRRYELALDLGLSRATSKFPRSAAFRFVIFGAEAEWGFRAAAAKYYEIYPESFECRPKHQGIWMPFTRISSIERAEDFGFAYDEGARDVAYDNAHDVLSFVYVEPWSLRFYMPTDVKPKRHGQSVPDAPSPAEVLEHPYVKQKLAKRIPIAKTSGIHTKDGSYSTRMYMADWARGNLVYDFLVSADPEIPGEVTKAKVMDERIFGWIEKERAKGNKPDGVYFDGFGEWRGPNENYRKELWKYADYPLTFSWETKKPVQLTCFAVYEYVEYMAKKLRPQGGFMMANGYVYRFPFTAHYLDAGGREIHWIRSTGDDNAFLDLCRTMAYHRAFLPLNNEDFTVFRDREVEKYFTKCLYYGFPPSMFSPGASMHGNFWNTAEFHNRERHLFKKYVPSIIKVAEAGWEPVTYARSPDPAIRLERFGTGPERNVHITAYNDSDEVRAFDISINRASLEINPRDNSAYDVLSARKLRVEAREKDLRVRGHLPAKGVAAIWLTSREAIARHYAARALKKMAAVREQLEKGKSPERVKRAVGTGLAGTAARLGKPPLDVQVIATEMANIRSLYRDEESAPASLRTDLEYLNEILSMAQAVLSGVCLEAAGGATAPAGRAARLLLRIENNGDSRLKDVELKIFTRENEALRSAGSRKADGVAPGSTRAFDVNVPVPEKARLGGYLPVLVYLAAERNGKPFFLQVRSSVIVSPLCGVRVERSEDGPKFVVAVRNNARDGIRGGISPKPPAGWTVRPAGKALSLEGLGSARYAFTLVPPQNVKAGVYQSGWEVAIGGMAEPFRQDIEFCYAAFEQNLLANGGFDKGQTGWEPYENGYVLVAGGRKGGRCIQCENSCFVEPRGAVQTVTLNQKKPTPLMLRAWSKAEDVRGGKNSNYSIYVDIRYTDGSPLYGQTIDFRPGTHDWEYAERIIEPAKPVQSMMVHALFRKHTGKVWFDDVFVCEVGK